MPSYFFLQIGLCRNIEDGQSKKRRCHWRKEFFCLDGDELTSISECEDGLMWRSPPAKFGVPTEALPSTQQVYQAAYARWEKKEVERLAEVKKQKELQKLLRKGIRVHAHAAAEAGAVEPEAPQLSHSVTELVESSVPVVALPPAHFVDNNPYLEFEPRAPAHFLDDFTYLDFETSDAFAIELAAVRVKDWQIVDQLQSFIQFRGTINSYAAKLTGIMPIDLWNAPEEKTVLQQFRKLAGDSLLVAHNAQFDLRHLQAARERQGASDRLINRFLCTLIVAKQRYPTGSHKLGDLCERFGISSNGAHRALFDVLMGTKLLECMHREQPIPESLVNVTSLSKKAKKNSTQSSLFAA